MLDTGGWSLPFPHHYFFSVKKSIIYKTSAIKQNLSVVNFCLLKAAVQIEFYSK